MAFVCVGLGVFGCSNTRPAIAPTAVAADSSDLGVFEAIVDTLQRSYGPLLSVSPWPSVARDPTTAKPSSQWQAVAAARDRVLLKKGVRVAKDASRGKCPLHIPLAQPESGCPASSEVRAAVGISGPNNTPAERTVRVQVTPITPGGATFADLGYVLALKNGIWVVVRGLEAVYAP
jgi:hypothetical protein